MAWVQRGAVVVIGGVSTMLALFVPSVYGMFIMAADIIYVIMLPQLVAAIFVPFSNTAGAGAGFVMGLALRVAAGEPLIGLPALLRLPLYSEDHGQLFPFRTAAMLGAFVTILVVSAAAAWFSNRFTTVRVIQLEEDAMDSKIPLNVVNSGPVDADPQDTNCTEDAKVQGGVLIQGAI